MKIRIMMFLLVSLVQISYATELRIAVAANVSYAMDELVVTFKQQHPSAKIRLILGSSGKLSAQIKNGAPYGLFMSANMDYPKALYEAGMAINKPRTYTQGTLALFSTKGQDFSQGIKVLNSKKIRRIAIANPLTAPYGKASVEAMQEAGIYKEVKEKLVYTESISQAVSYASVATDMGFIAKSSLLSQTMRKYQEGVHWSSVDISLYSPIKQGIVLLKGSVNEPLYKAFYEFVFTDTAKAIFKKYGYINE